MTSLLWAQWSPNFFRSTSGRFDLPLAADGSGWIVFDWERGRKARGGRAACEKWAEDQVNRERSR